MIITLLNFTILSIEFKQFPLTLAWAMTCHKCQGATIEAPMALVADFKSCWGSAMGYVMLGRVQRLSQLYLPNLDTTKIYANEAALAEALKMRSIVEERRVAAVTDRWNFHDTKNSLRFFSMNIQVKCSII